MLKDYYRILGISSRASAEEIETAFENLCRCLPFALDAASDYLAEAEEAYLVLSHVRKRAAYDRLCRWRAAVDKKDSDGLDFNRLSQDGIAGMPKNEEETGAGENGSFNGEGSFSKKEQITGLTERLLKENLAVFYDALINKEEIENKVSADIYTNLNISRSELGCKKYKYLEYRRYIICADCRGLSGKTDEPCSHCRGRGRLMAKRRVEIKISLPIKNRSILQIKDAGHQQLNGQPAGDLFVRIFVDPLLKPKAGLSAKSKQNRQARRPNLKNKTK